MSEHGHDSVDGDVARWRSELPQLDETREQVISRVLRIARHITVDGSRSTSADGLTTWQFKTLMALRREGPPYESSPSALAGELGLSRAATTARLGWLEDLGLLARSHEQEDRRRVRVRLTPDGLAAIDRVAAIMAEREGSIFAALSRREEQQLADLLRRVLTEIERRQP